MHHRVMSPPRTNILVHTVQPIPMIKAHSSGRMVSSSIDNVVIASVYSDKTHMKKLMIMRIMIVTQKPNTSKWNKRVVGMAKRFSKKYRNKR